MDKGLWYASLWCVILGMAASLAGGIWSRILRGREALKGHTTGRVVELILRENAQAGGNFRDAYYPVIEYYAMGLLFRVEYPEGSWPSAFAVGQEVPIDFDPDDPDVWQLGERSLKTYLPLLFGAAGIVLILAGAVIFLKFAVRG